MQKLGKPQRGPMLCMSVILNVVVGYGMHHALWRYTVSVQEACCNPSRSLTLRPPQWTLCYNSLYFHHTGHYGTTPQKCSPDAQMPSDAHTGRSATTLWRYSPQTPTLGVLPQLSKFSLSDTASSPTAVEMSSTYPHTEPTVIHYIYFAYTFVQSVLE